MAVARGSPSARCGPRRHGGWDQDPPSLSVSRRDGTNPSLDRCVSGTPFFWQKANLWHSASFLGLLRLLRPSSFFSVDEPPEACCSAISEGPCLRPQGRRARASERAEEQQTGRSRRTSGSSSTQKTIRRGGATTQGRAARGETARVGREEEKKGG